MDKVTREAVIRTFHNTVNFTGKTIKRFIDEQEKAQTDKKEKNERRYRQQN